MRFLPSLPAAAAIVLLCTAAGGLVVRAQTPEPGDDAVGELVGDLMFHADLLSALDAICPRRGRAAQDWHAALPALPPEATTLELIDLSRRLGADAGRQLVRDRGGCATRDFATAYAESRQTFGELLERWRQQ